MGHTPILTVVFDKTRPLSFSSRCLVILVIEESLKVDVLYRQIFFFFSGKQLEPRSIQPGQGAPRHDAFLTV